MDDYLRKAAASGTGATSTLDILQKQLDDLTQLIYKENGGTEFNIRSPAQVAKVLFGSKDGGSTSKEVLEAKAASGHRMADLILAISTSCRWIEVKESWKR